MSGAFVLNKVHYFNLGFLLIEKDLQFIVSLFLMWSHLGLNQGPPDYESDALTN